jgi:C1A family cysteine protease
MHRASKLLFATTLLVGACAPEADDGSDPSTPDIVDNEAPLSSYDDVFAGTPDDRTLPFDVKADEALPAKHTELLATQSPVKSQGSRGVCSIFSSVALMEHLYLRAGWTNPDFSEQYLQWSVKYELGDYTWTEGSNADSNVQAIAEFGIPREEAWPYESFPWTASNDPACGETSKPTQCFTNGQAPESAQAAEQFTLPRPKYLSTRGIKSHIKNKLTGVVIGVDFFYQSWNHRKSTLPTNPTYWGYGYVLSPNSKDVEESHKQRAGHSVLIVGWDDNLEVQKVNPDGSLRFKADGSPDMEKGFYIFKNSWGTGRFGVNNPNGDGYGYISYKYVNDYASAVVSDLPAAPAPPPPPPPPSGGVSGSSSPALAIPDANTTGVSNTIALTSTDAIGRDVVVTVDISHTWVGDLVVTLTHAGKTVTLHNATGGNADDLRATFTLSDFNGLPRGGDWVLKVVDTARADVGVVNSWSVSAN